MHLSLVAKRRAAGCMDLFCYLVVFAQLPFALAAPASALAMSFRFVFLIESGRPSRLPALVTFPLSAEGSPIHDSGVVMRPDKAAEVLGTRLSAHSHLFACLGCCIVLRNYFSRAEEVRHNSTV